MLTQSKLSRIIILFIFSIGIFEAKHLDYYFFFWIHMFVFIFSIVELVSLNLKMILENEHFFFISRLRIMRNHQMITCILALS